MANRKHKSTKEERKINKKKEISQQYDYDIFVGKGFLMTLPDILNKRFADGWKYVQVIRLGKETRKIPVEDIYGVLYEKIVDKFFNITKSLSEIPGEIKHLDIKENRIFKKV